MFAGEDAREADSSAAFFQVFGFFFAGSFLTFFAFGFGFSGDSSAASSFALYLLDLSPFPYNL